MEKIGLIAGNRKFPILVASAAKKKDYSVVTVAIKGDTSPAVRKFSDKVYWLRLSEFGRMFEIFRQEGIKSVMMAGQVSPGRLFSREVEDDPVLRDFLRAIKDKKAETIFGAVAGRLQESGIELLDSTLLIQEYLPKKGSLTENEPDFSAWEDIYFGFELAKEIAFLDIGQTVAVKSKAIVAVEALEGTDNLIRRAGSLSRGGFTLVKVSKPMQDKRFDIPVVGLNTVKNLIRSRARCLAIEAGKTLFIDREESVALARRKGLAIVAV
ncbi:MAG: LpxI family protein [Candidatus Omnitrophica bacterium]|nr:LpxI family protein [Candidatus Omnitrophota bacterium]